jgi:hypothetical protein
LPEQADPQKRRDQQYREYCAWVSEQWKAPAGQRSPQRADVGPGVTAGKIERQGEQWRGGR